MPSMPDPVLTSDEIDRNRKMVRHLKNWFLYRGLTQERIANNLGVSQGSLSKWLKGTQSMSVGHFTALAALLSAEPHQLLFPPDAPEAAAAYQRATGILSLLDEKGLEQWLGVGEAMATRQPRKV